MYWRYFMWNFAGRQNDIQSSGEIEHGNWITGIPFIDNLLYGDQNMLPQELKDNKGHNVFYCLPLHAGNHRTLLAGMARSERHPAVLGGILPVLHDRYRHCALPQPDTRDSRANVTMRTPVPSMPSPSGSAWVWRASYACCAILQVKEVPAAALTSAALPARPHTDGRARPGTTTTAADATLHATSDRTT